MKKLILNLSIASFILLLLSSCGKDNNDDDNNSNVNDPITQDYVTAASYGDLISFSIDSENKTYSYHNETTSETGSGSFEMSTDPLLQGVYEVSQGGITQYIIEIPNVIAITTLQLGNTLNKMAVGLSADVHHTNQYTLADFAGQYLFMNFDDDETYPGEFWGGAQASADGSYSIGSGDEQITSISFSGVSGGTLSIDANDNSRVIFNDDNMPEPTIGSIYPGKALIIDNGPGSGFSFAVTYPDAPVSQSSLAGSYKGVLIAEGSGQGAMNLEIPASGTGISYYLKFNSGEIYQVSNGTGPYHSIDSFERVPTLNNVFKMEQTVTIPGEPAFLSTSYAVLLPGDILMYFGVEYSDDYNREIVATYGISAKIN